VLHGDVGQRGELAAAGVGEDGIEARTARGNLIDQGIEIAGVADIALDAVHAGADGRGGLVEAFAVATGDEHIGALSGESSGGGQPDPRGRAGHECGLAVE
jgi:hypothetical protein